MTCSWCSTTHLCMCLFGLMFCVTMPSPALAFQGTGPMVLRRQPEPLCAHANIPRRAAVAASLSLPVLLSPQPSAAAKGKKSSGGKWAQHYDEFTEEELEGFTETESGLQYKDVEEGGGAIPKKGEGVYVHYSGYLLESGNLFDSSYERGKPLNFALGTGRVIKGWDEGLSTMKVGGRRILIIPANLGYGKKAVGPIPANSDLIFYVELVSIGS